MISVSLLSAYEYCKRKLFLERVLGLSEGPRKAPIKGKVRHKIYEEISNAEEQIVTSITSKDKIQDIFALYNNSHAKIIRRVLEHYEHNLKSIGVKKLELFREIWPLFQQEAKSRAGNTESFIQKYKMHGAELWQRLTPKIKSELKIISEDLNLIGKIDQVELYEDTIVPVELKTGSCPQQGIWPGHRIQISAYALLLEERFKKQVKHASVIYLDQNIRRTITVNQFMRNEVIELRKEVEHLLNSKEIPDFTQNQNKCAKCGLKELCHDEDFIQTRCRS